jgi:hypothetical protein
MQGYEIYVDGDLGARAWQQGISADRQNSSSLVRLFGGPHPQTAISNIL